MIAFREFRRGRWVDRAPAPPDEDLVWFNTAPLEIEDPARTYEFRRGRWVLHTRYQEGQRRAPYACGPDEGLLAW